MWNGAASHALSMLYYQTAVYIYIQTNPQREMSRHYTICCNCLLTLIYRAPSWMAESTYRAGFAAWVVFNLLGLVEYSGIFCAAVVCHHSVCLVVPLSILLLFPRIVLLWLNDTIYRRQSIHSDQSTQGSWPPLSALNLLRPNYGVQFDSSRMWFLCFYRSAALGSDVAA